MTFDLDIAVNEKKINTQSAEETIKEGKNFGSGLRSGDVVALTGDLGAGKTAFTQGICEALNVKKSVISPTFTIVNEYDGLYKVFHFDAYRIESQKEFISIGFEDYLLEEGICIIEWADKIKDLLPERTIWVKFYHDEINEDQRELRIKFPEVDIN